MNIVRVSFFPPPLSIFCKDLAGLHHQELRLIIKEAFKQYVGAEIYFERTKIELWYRNRNVMIG